MEFICVVIGLGIVGAVIFFWNNNRIDEAWTSAANSLRLQFSKDGLLSREISGDRAGFAIRVSTSKEGVGKEAVTVTGYHLGFRKPLGLELFLNRQERRTGFARIDSGGLDIVLGDPVFDPNVIVNGSDENQVREYLGPENRNLLLGLFKKFDEFELTPSGIHLAKKGVEANAIFLERNVKHLIEVADKIGIFEPSEAQNDEVTPPPLPKRDEIDPDTVIELKPANVEEASIKEAEIEEAVEFAETVVSEVDVASSTISDAIVPKEPKIENLESINKDEAREKTAPVKTAAATIETKAKEATGAPENSQKDTVTSPPTLTSDGEEFRMLCEDLFDSGLSRFEMGRTFDSEIKGSAIEGGGTLRRIDKFSTDLVFGRGPGLCAQLEIMKPEKGSAIMAFVEMPSDDLKALREKIGTEVTFSGELLKCDPFTNRIYVGQSN